MSQDELQVVSKSALRFLSGTFISRFSGMFRDISMAFCFGSHPAIAAFMVAFRFANLFRRLLGEGVLPSSFIPHFETLKADSEERGRQFFRDLFFSLLLFLTILILLCEGALFIFAQWGGITSSAREIVTLTMLMMPGVLFICLFGLCSALLACEKKFFLAGVAPVAFNAVWIAAVWGLKKQDVSQAMMGLSIAVIVAFAMQWLMTMHGSWRLLLEKRAVRLFSGEIRQIIKPLFLSIIGVGASQMNSALDAIFARFASLEGPAYLWYAIRLEQLPLALFGIALSSALLPLLSRAVQADSSEKYQKLLSFAIQRSFTFMMPCTVAFFVLGASGVNLLYGRGDFSQEATRETIHCLWGYGIGLIPAAFVLLLAPGFYAKKDYKTPTVATCYTVLLNMALNALFVFCFHWGTFSIAVATSLSSFFNVYMLMRRKEVVWNFPFWLQFAKVTLLSLLAAGVGLLVSAWLKEPTLALLWRESPSFTRHIVEQFLQFGALFLAFCLSLWLFSRLLRVKLL